MPRRSAPTASCPRATKRRSSSTTAWPTSRAPGARGGWPAAEPPGCGEVPVVALFLRLGIVAIVLGIVGVVAKGLLYLLIIGIVVFLAALLLGGLRMRRRPGRRQARQIPPATLDASVRGTADAARHLDANETRR